MVVNSNSSVRPFVAHVSRDGKQVYLGTFATAEEAALAVARMGGAAKRRRCQTGPIPSTVEEAEAQARWAEEQAEAEGLMLQRANNQTGFAGVTVNSKSKMRPFQAQVKRDGKAVYLGAFATAEEAALCIARSPEGQAAAERPAAAPPLTSEEADVVEVEVEVEVVAAALCSTIHSEATRAK